MPRIALVYFSQSVTDYTPLDLAYIVANITPILGKSYEFDIVRLPHRREKTRLIEEQTEARQRTISANANQLIDRKPDAIFFLRIALCGVKYLLWDAQKLSLQEFERRPHTYF